MEQMKYAEIFEMVEMKYCSEMFGSKILTELRLKRLLWVFSQQIPEIWTKIKKSPNVKGGWDKNLAKFGVPTQRLKKKSCLSFGCVGVWRGLFGFW